MKRTLLLLLLCSATLVQAQTFQKTISAGPAATVAVTAAAAAPDNGLIFCGDVYYQTTSSYAVFIAKTSAAGQLEWNQELNFGGPTYCNATRVGSCVGGGYYVMGTLNYSTDYFLAKFSSTGAMTWCKTYTPGLVMMAYKQPMIRQSPTGEFVINVSSGESMVVMKIDANGDLDWGKSFLGDTSNGKCPGLDCELSGDGSLLMTGKRGNDRMMVKTDANGNTQWVKMIADGLYTHLRTVKQASDGNYYIAGYVMDLNMAFAYGMLMKVDGAGNTLWRKHYSVPSSDMTVGSTYFEQILLQPNGDLLLTGSLGAYYNPFVMRTDAAGNVLFMKTQSPGVSTYVTTPPTIDRTGDGYLVYSSNTYFGSSALFKTDIAMNGVCAFGDDGVVTMNYAEPSSQVVGSGCTIQDVGTMASYNVTLSTLPLVLDDYCPLLGIDDPATPGLNVFPVPASENETVTIALNENFSGTIELFDLSGKKVRSMNVENQTTLTLGTAALSRGMYLVKATDENQQVRTAKLVVR